MKLIFEGEELLATRPTPSWRSTLVGCPRLLIQYIRSYPSYLEAVSSIRNDYTSLHFMKYRYKFLRVREKTA
jgi:hypothetical protein